MTCSTCDPWGSLSGRVVTGRNVPGENIRYPGVPLSDAQRAERHYQQYGTRNIPPRGTGLGQPVKGSLDVTGFIQGLTVGFILGAFVLTATGRGMLSAGGRKIQRRLER